MIALAEIREAVQIIVKNRFEDTVTAEECRQKLQRLAEQFKQITGRTPRSMLHKRCGEACWIRILAANQTI